MPNKLSSYHAKRNFNVTREPKGRVQASHDELQFVVQEHHASKLHYDFRLELDGVLKSWTVPKGPSLDPNEKRLAVHVEDHPIAYAGFEGTIPENQYGAGRVRIWDSGYWEPIGDPAAAYRAGKLKFRLYGEKLQGGWALIKTRLRGGSDKEQWLLIKERDEAAQDASHASPSGRKAGSTQAVAAKARAKPAAKGAVQASPRKRTALKPSSAQDAEDVAVSKLANALKAPLPAAVNAQLATLVEHAPTQGDWIYEIKYDGYRILARIESGRVQLMTRDGKDWTARLPRQVEALQELGLKNAWLDGEIVVLDGHGIPSFQQLQNAFDAKSTAKVIFFAFDLLYLDGYDLRNVPLLQRRGLLERALAKADQEHIRYSAPLHEPAEKLLDSACQLSMEGIIGKLSDSIYTGKRSADWIKLKCRKRQEFVIAGFTDPQGKRQFFGSLLLAVFTDDGVLRYAGRVGTGFDNAVLQSVYKKLKPLMQSRCPFPEIPRGPGIAKAHWLKPKLVAEISFAEWTKDGLLRQAVFHGLRTDKPAGQIRREQAVDLSASRQQAASKRPAKSRSKLSASVENAASDANTFHGIVITHPERVIDPSSGLTKLDIARYYDAVAPFILPYLKDRPVYLLRSPGGLSGKAFFQRHAIRAAIPGIQLLDPSVDPEHEPLMVINSAQALIGAAQMGSLELHSCNATADMLDRPDCMVFDLDPDPNLPWKRIAESAKLTRQLLDELGLTCFLKTSGSKGLHLIVPLARRHDWESVTQFSKALAQHLANTIPGHFIASMGEENRVGKIYIDYLRNSKMASTVVPYSTRARNGLPVAVPIAWEELDDIKGSAMWNIVSIQERLVRQKSDPWQDFFSTRQILTKSMRKALGIIEGSMAD
ncbi:DNA ligase D [Oxalobacteraceae bacterium R-40]|uniref:DNA ligase (ATP) n=1 Tax=Keguizhuia sedimenti TaxID=3064264 RepID=A0ABU1BKI2_9BURK|nr:DNA ligase D [Oxalobacteraceae bacterium R-40]